MDTIVVSGEVGGRRRRRSHSEELKRRMVAECAEPGASVSLVAPKYDVNANLLFSWRRQFAPQTSPALDRKRSFCAGRNVLTGSFVYAARSVTVCAAFQAQGMSSSIRLFGWPLTIRVRTSVR